MKSSNIKGKIETIKTKENLSQILGNENLNNPSKIIKDSDQIKKPLHKNSIKCLNYCTLYTLNLTIKQNKSNIGYQFNNNKIAYFCQNISSSKVFSFLKQKEELEGLNINKFNLKQIFVCDNNKKILSQNLSFPIENLNQINNEIKIWEDPSVLLLSSDNRNSSCILLEFDLDSCKEQNIYFREINKSFIDREIKCTLNGIVHEKELLKKDITFSIDSKQLIKSIEKRIRDYKKNYLNTLNKRLFQYKYSFITPLIDMPNIGIIISTNNKKDLSNIDELQINFNSIISKKFLLLKLLVAIDIPNYISKPIRLSDDIMSNSNLSHSSKEVKTFSMNSEGDSLNNFNLLNTQLSVNSSPKKSSLNNSYNEEKIKLNNSYTSIPYFHNNINNKYYSQNPHKGKYNQYRYNKNLRHSCFIPKKQKNYIDFMDIRKEKSNHEIKIKQIFINKNNKFSNEIFNKFKTKSNYLSNYLIFKKTVKMHFSNKKNLRYMSLELFFKIFERISSFGLPLPLINEKGNYNQVNYSPSLSSLILYIQNIELYDFFLNSINNSHHLSSISTQSNNSEDNNNNNNICGNNNNNGNSINNIIQFNDFNSENTKISLLSQTVIIEFNETKPPFLRESLYEKINRILYPIKNSKIKVKLSEIDLEKSFFVISWNPTNSFQNQTSFLTYYTFNSNLIGILPIKLEASKWLGRIGLSENETLFIGGNELKENITKIENFLSNYSFYDKQQNLPNVYSSDYEFYLKNKFIVPK